MSDNVENECVVLVGNLNLVPSLDKLLKLCVESLHALLLGVDL